jgi:hypothetical protein
MYSSLKLFGIYNGGPPVPIQYECLKAARIAFNEQVYPTDLIAEIYDIAKNVYNNDVGLLYSIKNLVSLMNEKGSKKFLSEFCTITISNISKCAFNAHQELKNNNENYYFNVCLPVTHPSFQKAVAVRTKFSEIDFDFNSLEEFKDYLVN